LIRRNTDVIKFNYYYYEKNKDNDLFYGENISKTKSIDDKLESIKTINSKSVIDDWKDLIEKTIVPKGWKNSDLHLAAYIKNKNNWVLSSWIWTSAALANYFYSIQDIDNLKRIADRYIELQLPEGGWIVRSDIVDGNEVRTVAPNDSAYISFYSQLNAYKTTKEKKYLSSAINCADWILKTKRDGDHLVYVGQNFKTKEWIKKVNIVDIGFTIPLFVSLYQLTNKPQYLEFANNFSKDYIKKFYNSKMKLFYTSIDDNDNGFGGFFSRGQAWALEGLIPLYLETKDNKLYEIIDNVINQIVKNQHYTGTWPYNISRKIYGFDPKGISILSYSILRWFEINPQKVYLNSVLKANKAAQRLTSRNGIDRGLINAYSIEGAITHSRYSKTGMVYTTAYALMVYNKLEEIRVSK
jgi:rhamnogalacturonyl hydrolase YesR